MDYEKFICSIRREVLIKLGEDYSIDIRHVIKNNSVELDGLVIIAPGEHVSPSIYLNDYYFEFSNGRSVISIVSEIIDIYKREISGKCRGLRKFSISKDFDEIKDRIIARMVNKDMNEQMLKESPYIEFMDLAIVFYYLVEEDEETTATIRVTYEVLRIWNIDEHKCAKVAMENTVKKYPVKVKDMRSMLGELVINKEIAIPDDFIGDDGISDGGMYVITNIKNSYGAVCMLYEGVISGLANAVNSDLIIIPSSVHEVICIKKTEDTDLDEIVKMVEDVNDTQVSVDELLSYYIYIYDRTKDKFIIHPPDYYDMTE